MCPREVNVQMVELRVIVEEDSQLVGGVDGKALAPYVGDDSDSGTSAC